MVDGRDVEALCQVFWQASQVKNKPSAVVAKTFKGRGIPSKQMFPFCLGFLKTSVCIAMWQKEAQDGKADKLALCSVIMPVICAGGSCLALIDSRSD